MDESLIRGLVIGAVFLVIGGAAHLVWKLLRSQSEGARRVRWVLLGLVTLFVGAIVLQSFGFGTLVATVLAGGVVYWIYAGFKKKGHEFHRRPLEPPDRGARRSR